MDKKISAINIFQTAVIVTILSLICFIHIRMSVILKLPFGSFAKELPALTSIYYMQPLLLYLSAYIAAICMMIMKEINMKDKAASLNINFLVILLILFHVMIGIFSAYAPMLIDGMSG